MAYLFQADLKGCWGGGGGRDRGWGGLHVFNQERRMVSALPKGLEYKVEKLKSKKVGGHAPEDQNLIRTSSSWISPYKVLQSSLINTVLALLVKND